MQFKRKHKKHIEHIKHIEQGIKIYIGKELCKEK